MITNRNHKTVYNQKFILRNTLAERIIIGTLIYDLSLKKVLKESLSRHFFSIKKNQLLYSFLIHLEKQDKTRQVLQITHTLWEKGLLEDAGGVNNIVSSMQISQTFYLSKNKNISLKYFINVLYYYYLKRLFIQYSYNLIHINFFHRISINRSYNLAKKQLNNIARCYYLYELKYINNDVSSVINKKVKELDKNIKILSGFENLDKITNGFKEGDLIIIAGRPSMGKTSFAINIINYLSIKLDYRVHMFSLEMSKEEILYRMLSLLSNLPVEKIEKQLIFGKEWSIIQKAGYIIMNSLLRIDDKGSSSIEYIQSQCQNYKINKAIFVIDYLQLIKVENYPTDNRAQEIGHITRNLKLLTRELKTTAIVLSQLNRNIENRANKRPLLSDLRESGCIALSTFPRLYKYQELKSLLILHCFKQYYNFNRIKKVDIKENNKQHVFSLINLTQVFISTTHNHKIFAHQLWHKEDQLKFYEFNTIENKTKLNTRRILELNKSLSIKFLGKAQVYDVSLESYHNFTINTYIVHNSIEQDADLILMLYKNEHYSDDKIIDIVIAKHRHGPIGSCQLLFHADTCRFSNTTNNTIYY